MRARALVNHFNFSAGMRAIRGVALRAKIAPRQKKRQRKESLSLPCPMLKGLPRKGGAAF